MQVFNRRVRLAGSVLAPMFLFLHRLEVRKSWQGSLGGEKEREVLLFYNIPTSSKGGVKLGVWLHSLSIPSLCQMQSWSLQRLATLLARFNIFQHAKTHTAVRAPVSSYSKVWTYRAKVIHPLRQRRAITRNLVGGLDGAVNRYGALCHCVLMSVLNCRPNTLGAHQQV